MEINVNRKSIFSSLSHFFLEDIIHFMCEYRIWTKSDDELINMFMLKPNHGVVYENYC